MEHPDRPQGVAPVRAAGTVGIEASLDVRLGKAGRDEGTRAQDVLGEDLAGCAAEPCGDGRFESAFREADNPRRKSPFGESAQQVF